VSGFRGLLQKSPNMDSLVALGAGAAFVYSVIALFAMSGAVLAGDEEKIKYLMNQFYFESAATILTLITVGKALEAIEGITSATASHEKGEVAIGNFKRCG